MSWVILDMTQIFRVLHLSCTHVVWKNQRIIEALPFNATPNLDKNQAPFLSPNPHPICLMALDFPSNEKCQLRPPTLFLHTKGLPINRLLAI